MAPGGLAGWFAAVSPVPAGLASDELAALPRPSVSSALGGPHSLVAGSTSTAPGFGSSGSAGAGPLLGGAVSQTFPRPTPPIGQGTGGDGHVPILVGTKVFAFFHHQSPTKVSCIDRTTGMVCPGYPRQLNVGASDINGPGAVTGDRIWWHAMLGNGAFAQSASIGLQCWDAGSDSPCGMAIADRVPATTEQAASHPVLAAGKIWFAANTGKLYCREAASGAPCATPSLTTGLTGGPTNCVARPSPAPCMDLVAHGSRVFASLSGDKVACLDVVALQRCNGWAAPKAFNGNWNLVNKHDASGATVGICVIAGNGGGGECVDDAMPATTTTISGWPAGSPPYHASQEAEAGTRTLVARLGYGGAGCYDWKTSAPCTGGGYDAGGWLDHDTTNQPLPSGYGVTFDGTCGVALGDPGEVFTVDVAGYSPCTTLRSGSGTGAIDLRTQRCDGGVGGAGWKAVKLTDSDATELDHLTVTVRDAQTHAVLLTGDLIPGGTLDISGIDPAQHPSIEADASVAAKSSAHPWDDGVPPRIVISWTPDPRHVCIQTKASDECAAGGTSSLGFTAHVANPARSASAQLSLRRRACPEEPAPGGHGGPAAGHDEPAPEPGGAPPAVPAPFKCSGLRSFPIHVVFKGRNVRRIVVTANGKRQRVLRLVPRPVVQVNLRKRPKQTVIVRITIRTKRGRTIRGKRTYHPCHEVRLPGHTYFKL